MQAKLTPRAMRYNIVLIGRRNTGKSSLLNALTNQSVSIVSDVAGTTTDVVTKPYELLPLGAVTFFDTAGLDDDSNLGLQRINATRKALYKADIVIFTIDEKGITDFDIQNILKIKQMNIPLIAVFTKEDIEKAKTQDKSFLQKNDIIYTHVSSIYNKGITELKNMLIKALSVDNNETHSLLDDIIRNKDIVILVTPIDNSAPKDRLILPQVQILRNILDENAVAVVTKVNELEKSIKTLKDTPKIVITDSQVVSEVNKIVPQHIDITTFSILFARFKGDLKVMVDGAKKIDTLDNNIKILIVEACSHHAQDDDIARIKIPALLKKYTKKNLDFEFCTGCDFPEMLEKYDLVIHCGACMLNRVDMNRRLNECVRRGVAITNYGVAISKTQGVFDRVIKPFGL